MDRYCDVALAQPGLKRLLFELMSNCHANGGMHVESLVSKINNLHLTNPSKYKIPYNTTRQKLLAILKLNGALMGEKVTPDKFFVQSRYIDGNGNYWWWRANRKSPGPNAGKKLLGHAAMIAEKRARHGKLGLEKAVEFAESVGRSNKSVYVQGMAVRRANLHGFTVDEDKQIHFIEYNI